MLEIFSKILKVKSAVGLSIHFVNQNEYEIAYCIVSESKGNLSIDDYKQIASLGDLKNIVKDKALYLNISGKVVLEKIIQEIDHEAESAFPNSELNDFYYQLFEQDSHTISSLIRKEKAAVIIESLMNLDLNPIALSIGISISSNAFQNISELNNEFYCLLGKEIKLNKSQILSIDNSKNESDSFYIDNNNLTQNEFIAFASAMSFLFEEGNIEVYKVLENQKENFLYKQIFDKLKIAIPVFFLVVLLINFLLFSNLLSKNELLTQGDSLNKTSINQLEVLKNDVKRKQDFLKETNWLSQSKVSYYADQIGLLLPSKIALIKLDIFPAKLIKKNNTKEYRFDNKTIFIEGYSDNLEELNKWKLLLQKQKWIQDIELVFYKQETERKSISFELKLNLN